jgi:hypothetical protein
MTEPPRALTGDLASFLLDVAPEPPCSEGSFVCWLRAGFDYALLAAIALAACIALGFLLALSFSVAAARFERSRRPVPARRRRLLSGPIHSDGTWIRLVEDERGRPIVEVLEGTRWTPSTRGLSQFVADVPTRPLPRA